MKWPYFTVDQKKWPPYTVAQKKLPNMALLNTPTNPLLTSGARCWTISVTNADVAGIPAMVFRWCRFSFRASILTRPWTPEQQTVVIRTSNCAQFTANYSLWRWKKLILSIQYKNSVVVQGFCRRSRYPSLIKKESRLPKIFFWN